MQRCPTCNNTYVDNSLSFCLSDGTALVPDRSDSYDPAKTLLSPTPAPTSSPLPPTQVAGGGKPNSNQPYQQPWPQSPGWTPPPPQAYGYPPRGGYPPLGYAPRSGQGTGLSKAALFTGVGSLGSFLLAVVLVMTAIRSFSYSLIMVAGILSWLALLSALAAIILGIITLANANKNPAINRIHGILGLCFGGLTLLIWLSGLARRF